MNSKNHKDLYRLDATDLAFQIRSGVTSATEAVETSLARIAAIDDSYKAFIHVDAAGALTAAKALDNLSDTETRGPLFGVPIAVKDLTDVKGMPTTHGSLLRGQEDAAQDDLIVARLRAAGAIIIGKTNTPEFGFGAVCTNRRTGPTRNPWNPTLTSGGSSGGSAVAVTTGMVALAQGTDFGGSVRTPASFTGCVGLRPTLGSIPDPTRPLGWSALATQGVLARSAQDAELMASVMAGSNRHDPLSGTSHTPGVLGRPLRVAATATMGGTYRIDPDVRTEFNSAIADASEAFGVIDDASPSTDGASNAFQVLRAAQSWLSFGSMVEDNPESLTESFVWNVRQGRNLSAEDYLKAEKVRTHTYRAFQAFFDRYDILLTPAASVLPFPNDQGEVTHLDGTPCETIIDYLACTYIISLVGFPALVLPTPRSRSTPFGLQLVARPGNENILFAAAQLLAEKAGFVHAWADLQPDLVSAASIPQHLPTS